MARIGTWNVRWFPEGGPGKEPHAERATDVPWLACAIALLDVDLLAVQEFKAHARAQEAVRELIELLDRHTAGAWRIELDDCPNRSGQHVGVLYDSSRVEQLESRQYDELNPHGVGCQDQLRPGMGGYYRFAGGLDLHVASVHLKSGTTRRSLDLRQRSLASLASTRRQLNARSSDDDLLVLGDFNTMGCPRCSVRMDADAELGDFEARLAGLGFRRLSSDPGCSEYYRGHGGLLDHLVVTATMAEARGVSAEVWGYCRSEACGRVAGAMPAAYHRLSDHCPLVAEFVDTDLD